jgi:hypothetical protein
VPLGKSGQVLWWILDTFDMLMLIEFSPFFIFTFVMLGIEPRASCVLGKHLPSSCFPSPHLML